jgi:hypothetical protein
MAWRGAVAALALFLLAGAAAAEAVIIRAALVEPTTRYDHGVLGDAVEWAALEIDLADGQRRRLRLPETSVFEDVEARLADLDQDGRPEVVVVETDMARGAMLAVYDADGRRAATRPVGQRHRWLAPAGIGDLDGDGRVEIAYVDRPHLARQLVIVRLEGDRLVEIARQSSVTNHRIGDARIAGGIRDCGDGAELVALTPDWTTILIFTLQQDGRLASRADGPNSPNRLAQVMACAS